MDKKIDFQAMQQAAAQASGLLKVLANSDRLLLLCQMSQGEYCVSDLEEVTGIKQPTLSQQLSVLREEKMVSTRREGKQIFYNIASPEAMAVMKVLYALYCKQVHDPKEVSNDH
ncbi:metalloregulator ArsR/SmtB family transcription factor [Polaromonas sp. CG_9.11]|uniref:ArsR/SmtB family transcription factor n=1 Tax=Polaromonas sp. CG_9.11 TaxID=2787730 RepID=UPI0018CB21B7|nr:metalloregulator ArsR/SmtB family transcription factor [Polaromonas sp. CG_9.11]MBG6078008.1 ArsR family transcriptional regulator [Polaromonas sp. CG_9.11]